MATQIGSIDLTATSAAKLAAEASISSALGDYTTHAQLEAKADSILGTVSETYSTENSVSSRFSTVNQKVDGLEITMGGKVDSDEPWVSWLHAGVDETTHVPYLAMGQDSDYPSVVYGSSAAKFYDGAGDADSNVVAQFGSSGSIVGKTGSAHFEQTSSAAKWYGSDGTTQLAEISTDNNVPRLWLKDQQRSIIAGQVSSTSSGVTTYTDTLNINSIGYNNSHNAYVQLQASGTDGSATIRVSDGATGADVTVTPSMMHVNTKLKVVRDFEMTSSFNTVALGTTAKAAWLAALGLDTETIYETSTITIKRTGREIMVQCHGVTGTPNSSTPLANVDMSAYKPSYNASAIVCDTQSTTHFARLWVSASDGKPYLAFAGYSSSSTWYGTLTYIY